MKVSDIATERGISKQAVYQRLKTAHIKVDSLTDPKTGELTADGQAVIEKLFLTEKTMSQSMQVKTLTEVNKDLLKQVDSLTERVKALQETVTMKEDRIRELTADNERLQRLTETMYINGLPWYKRRRAEKMLLLTSGDNKTGR